MQPQDPLPVRIVGWIVASVLAVGVIVGLFALLGVFDDTSSGPEPPPTVTSHTPQGPVIAPAPAVEQAASDGETGLGDENITPQDQRHNDAQAGDDTPSIVGPPPAATPHQAGCTTRSNSFNFNYRNGVRPSLVVLHLTVAPNRPGWGDINGVAIFLNRPATQASSNYIIDAEGHCLYTVAETLKAWTQGNLNSASACSLEVQNTGSEPTYAGTAGLAKIAKVVHDCAHRWDIPLRHGSVSGSRVTRSGVLAHIDLGVAGGGHVDIRRFGAGCRRSSSTTPDVRPCVDLVIAKARALDKPPVTASARRQCRELNTERKAGRRGSALARKRKANLTAHGYVCTEGAGGKPGSIRRR